VLGYVSGLAFALALFFLTTILACTWLNRLQGALFAAGAFLLQAAVMVLTRTGVIAVTTLAGQRAGSSLTSQDVAVNLFVFMFTFFATSWLVASRAERLRTMGGRLRAVTSDLQALQAFNEHVVRSMSASVVTTDLAGSITFANAAAERLLGQRAAGLAGRSLHELLGWQALRAEDLRATRAALVPRRQEREAVLGARRAFLEVAVTRLEDQQGRVLGLIFLLEDVSELRALEDEVRLKEKMAAIGEMAAGIAHEIRNPLASISGSVQMLSRHVSHVGDPGRLVDIVLQESSRLDRIVSEFLEFARPRPTAVRAVDLAALARETVTLLSHSDEVLPTHELRAPEGGPVLAEVDPDQVRQVVWNLCKNALKAMPAGGVMSVVVGAAGEDAVVLEVGDTGVGMSTRTLATAFQPLTGEFEGGMGLGLAIVYRIVKDHGGRVDIETREGQGTLIRVRLPATATVRSR
jgi:two-component system sensor histidine kinase PilS (NtrC family)